MADPPQRPTRPMPPLPPSVPPPASLPVRAPALGRPDSGVDEDEAFPEGRTRKNLGTVPLRPLVDIAQPRLMLTVERENGQIVSRSIVHEGDVCRIGTHPSNDLVLDDPSVSRFHCRLALDAQGWRVEDAGSTNGVFLHELRVLSAMLPAEAVLLVGQSAIRVHVSAMERALVPSVPGFGSIIGTGRAMQRLFAMLEKVAASDINCFIQGESGTGKELVATEVVQRGPRAERPFVVVDCGAISPNLVESELFGHVRGAFTGADRDRVGAFEAADGGTVFLDEVGELPLEVQPKLLRAIEAREVRRVGETRVRKVDVRVISATHRDLEREVNRGTFRGDLYFRLAVITVRVPPLRERPEDVPHLIRHFLESLGAEADQHLFGPDVISELSRHAWPGNVRELRNYVERSVVLKTARMSITPPPPSVIAGARPADVDVSVPFKVAKDALIEGFERAYLRSVLDKCGGNMTKAARVAGIDRMYLHRLVQKYATRDQLSSGADPASAQQRKPVE